METDQGHSTATWNKALVFAVSLLTVVVIALLIRGKTRDQALAQAEAQAGAGLLDPATLDLQQSIVADREGKLRGIHTTPKTATTTQTVKTTTTTPVVTQQIQVPKKTKTS